MRNQFQLRTAFSSPSAPIDVTPTGRARAVPHAEPTFVHSELWAIDAPSPPSGHYEKWNL